MLQDVLNEWDNDSIIDDNNITEETINIPKLHAKYLRLLMDCKSSSSKLKNDLNELKKLKFRYYRGELSREILTKLQWEQYQGTKPLKNEMDTILDGDRDLNKLKLIIDDNDNMIYALESILLQIKSRDWQLKNIISWKQFLSGA